MFIEITKYLNFKTSIYANIFITYLCNINGEKVFDGVVTADTVNQYLPDNEYDISGNFGESYLSVYNHLCSSIVLSILDKTFDGNEIGETGLSSKEMKEIMELFNFKISYMCYNHKTISNAFKAVNHSPPTEHAITGARIDINNKNQISLILFFDIFRMKKIMVDYSHLNEYCMEHKNHIDEKQNIFVGQIGVGIPSHIVDNKVISSYKQTNLMSANKIKCIEINSTKFKQTNYTPTSTLGHIKIIPNKDFCDIQLIEKLKKISTIKTNNFDVSFEFPTNLYTIKMLLLKEDIIDNERETTKKIVSGINQAVNCIKNNPVFKGEVNNSVFIKPKEKKSIVQKDMIQRSAELSEKFKSGVLFFSNLNLLCSIENMAVIKINLDNYKGNELNLVSLYNSMMYLKDRKKIKSLLESLLWNNKSIGCVPDEMYMRAVFDLNNLKDFSYILDSNKPKIKKNRGKSTSNSNNSTSSDQPQSPKQWKISNVLIYTSAGIVACGGIGGIVYGVMM